MAGVCNYQSKDPYYSGRDLDNYCSFTRNGDVEAFGTNRFIASWKLFSLTMRDTAQSINKAIRACLDPHNNQALSLHDGGMEGVKSPILRGEYDVTCGDTDPGLSGHNTEVTDTYTIDYEASLQCNNSNPIAVIKSVVTFHEEPGVDPNCLEANSTRFIEMDTSTTGTSGIIRAAVEKCIGLKNILTDQLESLPERTTQYIKEYRCRFSTNQTFTPIPSPSPSPNFSPVPSFSPSPNPSPFPSSSPFPSPSPFTSPSPFPSFSHSPNPSPFTGPSPFPSPSPDTSTEGLFEHHKILILVISAIAMIAFLFFAFCCYKRRSKEQTFQGVGPAVARIQPDGDNYQELQDRGAGTKKAHEGGFVEVPLITEDSPLILN